MSRRACRALAALLAIALLAPTGARADPPRFRPLELWIDTGDAPLAAYQVEISAAGAEIVGVEGGAPAAFADPPRYDPAALSGGRIVLAALTTEANQPRGRMRVATLHVREAQSAATAWRAELVVAAGPDGHRLRATAQLIPAPGDQTP